MTQTDARHAEKASLDDEAVLFLSPGDPARSAIRADPYPFYERLRTEAPVFKTSAGPWLITDYDVIHEFLRDNDWSREDHAPDTDAPSRRPPQQLLRDTMLFRDPPDHTRLRKLVNRGFTPPAIKRWQPRIMQITDALIDDLLQKDSFDLVRDYAFRIPLTVICEMLGVPLDHSEEFAHWADQIVESLEPNKQSDQARAEQDRAAEEAAEFFSAIVRERRSDPGDDIISTLLQVEREENIRVTTEEIVAMSVLLHISGHDTTGNLIGSAIHHLWSRPDQLALLDADRALMPSAIEEVLRFDAPARNSTPRRAWVDKEIQGHPIPAGDVVYGILGAADRDPSRFPDPHRFDVTRSDNRHIAFGVGIHFCLGAPLARVESACALQSLLNANRVLRVEPDPTWRDSFTIRGLEALHGSWA